MARPRLGEAERRRRTIGVRVTEAEETELRERAQAARLSMGAYLRRRALGQRVRIAAELRLGAAELRELNIVPTLIISSPVSGCSILRCNQGCLTTHRVCI